MISIHEKIFVFILKFSSVKISACSFLIFYQLCHSATVVVPYP